MDIKSFGLQDWVHRDLLCLHQIVTADKYADAHFSIVTRISSWVDELFQQAEILVLGFLLEEHTVSWTCHASYY
jgi:hypothetical protein